jgi:hypothetical protein
MKSSLWAAAQHCANYGRRVATVLTLPAVLGLAAIGVSAHAMDYPGEVYIYNSQGVPVYVSTDYYTDQHVFDVNNNLVGNVDMTYKIHDPNTNAIIGYVTT